MLGAHQEILGDLHNLFGDTNAVHVGLDDNGDVLDGVVKGDTVREVLAHVQYNAELLNQLRKDVETPSAPIALLCRNRQLLHFYETGLAGILIWKSRKIESRGRHLRLARHEQAKRMTLDRNAESRATLGRLQLKNPPRRPAHSATREMAGAVDFAKLGGIIEDRPARRIGNSRRVPSRRRRRNAIGSTNDSIDHFIEHHLPYLRTLLRRRSSPTSRARRQTNSWKWQRRSASADLAGLELNLSCPNVSGGADFATDPGVTKKIVADVRAVCPLPIIAKLTPNVTNIVPIAQAAADGGADAVSLVNTFVGMAIDWRKRKPILGNITGGLSGPAIKPLALRLVWQVARNVRVPIIGVGGIRSLDDVMEFLVAGASAVQIGTANFFDPTVSTRLVDELAATCVELGITSISEIVGTLQRWRQAALSSGGVSSKTVRDRFGVLALQMLTRARSCDVPVCEALLQVDLPRISMIPFFEAFASREGLRRS